MRKVFFVVLIAMLISCSQESNMSSPGESDIELQVNLSLGNVSTRAVDESIIASDGKGYVLPFTEVKTLTVELYKSLESDPIFTHTATAAEITDIKNTATGQLAKLSISKIPTTTQYVKVVINEFTQTNPAINQLQVTNLDDSPAPTMNRTEVPYEGVSKEIIVIPEETTLYSTKVKASVEMLPVLSRFEIMPGKIVITDPADTGATFDWADGTAGKDKITNFTDDEIAATEASARENFKKKYGIDASATAIYSYRIRLIRSRFPNDYDINSTSTTFYMNNFKQTLNGATIVNNINDGISDWSVLAEYRKGGGQSNMYDTRTSDTGKVNVFHLFPQSVAADATLQQIKDGMPHLIMSFSTGNKRWLTIRAFSDKSNDKIINAFEPGYCYSLDLDDVVITPWSLGLEVRITDKDKESESDPIIKDFDQTSHVPEPEGLGLTLGLKVSQWRNKDLEVEL